MAPRHRRDVFELIRQKVKKKFQAEGFQDNAAYKLLFGFRSPSTP